MRDREAVVWTRLAVQPLKMGTLYVTDKECRFTYTPEYVKIGLPGLGLVYVPALLGTDTLARARTTDFDFHPPLQALIPPHSETNFQRTLITRYLEKRGIPIPTRFDADWEIITRAGHGGIGHLDVFASDEEAVRWYNTPSKRELIAIDEKFGFSLKEFLTWLDDDAEILLELLGPTPSVGGAIPKLPLSIPRSGWDGRIGLPTRYGDSDRTDIILKLEKTATYPGIIELEQLGLEIHRKAGFEVPRYWPVEINGIRALAVERFDRDANCAPLFMESIYSVMASGKKSITHHYSDSYDSIGKALDNPRLQIVTDPRAATQHLFKRLVMAILTGNGDLHMENLSLLRRDGVVAFSPVYDPTPMRAYRRHDMLTPPGMTFGQYGELVGDEEVPVDFGRALHRFAKTLKLTSKVAIRLAEECLTACREYPDMIAAMQHLPDENKEHLRRVHQASIERVMQVMA